MPTVFFAFVCIFSAMKKTSQWIIDGGNLLFFLKKRRKTFENTIPFTILSQYARKVNGNEVFPVIFVSFLLFSLVFPCLSERDSEKFQATLFVILILPLALPGEESQKGVRGYTTMFLRSFTGKNIFAPRRCRPLFVLRTFFPFHRKNSQVRMTRNDKKGLFPLTEPFRPLVRKKKQRTAARRQPQKRLEGTVFSRLYGRRVPFPPAPSPSFPYNFLLPL